jgi:O-antigen ligase
MDKILKDKLPFYFGCIIMAIIPLYYWYLPPFIGLWLLVLLIGLFYGNWNIRNIPIQNKFLFGMFILFFIWQLIGLMYSDNLKEGWRNIELRLPLLVFPLVLIMPGEIILRKIGFLLKIFALCTFVFLCLCFVYAFYRSTSIIDGSIIFNHHIPQSPWLSYFYGTYLAMFQHPSYLSMYVLLSMYITLESIFNSTDNKSRYFYIILSIIFLFSIYLLSSRAAILATLISLPIYFLKRFKINWKSRLRWIFLFIGFIILTGLFISNPKIIYYHKGESKKDWTNLMLKESRIVLWKSAIKIIDKNLILGVGTGDIQKELNKEYKLIEDNGWIKDFNYNTHNQFIEILLEHGLIGLVLFLAMFGVLFYIAVIHRNMILFMFLIIILISFIFETMLNRLGGVSFFALFSFLLLHLNEKND